MKISGIYIGITKDLILANEAKAAIILVFPVPPFPLMTTNSFIKIFSPLNGHFFNSIV